MRYLHNIEKSAFRRFEYVGYADGAWRVRKDGCGGWEAEKFIPMTRELDPAVPRLRARTLADLSDELTAYSAKQLSEQGLRILPR